MTESDIWTVRAALDWTVGYLGRKGDENPRLSAEWLLSEATGLRRIELYVNFERPLSMDERDVLRGYVTRRGRGEPLQYITGEAAFRHIAVKVRPGVLIPRPETDGLARAPLPLPPPVARPRAADSRLTEGEAEALLAARAEDAQFAQASGAARQEGVSSAREGSEPDRTSDVGAVSKATSDVLVASGSEENLLVADLCTGTGCIACSIAHEHPRAFGVATDVEPQAVALARENAAALGLQDRVCVVECDLGQALSDARTLRAACVQSSDAVHDRKTPACPSWLPEEGALMGSFDLVVSNPPYVPTAVLSEIPREVADFEPALALDGGRDGLDVFRRLLPWCADALKPGGAFAFELHETCLDAAAALARAAGFSDVHIVRDLADRPRVLTGRRG